ncbi:MAG: hypothetical protein ABW202_13910 [Duganella sp.]
MSGLIAKLETDPAMRVLAGKIIANVMACVSVAAAVVVVYLSWAI